MIEPGTMCAKQGCRNGAVMIVRLTDAAGQYEWQACLPCANEFESLVFEEAIKNGAMAKSVFEPADGQMIEIRVVQG